MTKILLGIFLASSLYSQSYEELLELAINNNADLQQIESQQDIALLQGDIETRYKNPNLELEISSPYSLRGGINQEILLPSFKSELKSLTQHKVALSKEQLRLTRLEFIYLFAMRYIEYREAISKRDLEQERLSISEEIFGIANKRFTHGSIPKSEWLQSKLDKTEALTKIKELEFVSLQKKNELLKFANLDTNIEIGNDGFSLVQFGCKHADSCTHPQIELYKKRKEIAKSELKLASYNIESIELFSEIESEPDQEIFRVGISVALPIAHHKSQERQLAKINLQNQELQIAYKERAISLQIEQLQSEIEQLNSLKESYQNRIVEKQELLDMYKRGYEVAQVNLLKLNQVKKQLLQSKSKLLQADIEIEKKEIKIAYLQGGESE